MEVVVRLSSRGRKYQDWFQNVLFLERWGLVYRIVCTGTRYGLFLWSNHGQLFFFFFLHLICYLRPSFSLSLLVVTQIRGHIAGSSPPLPTTFLRSKGHSSDSFRPSPVCGTHSTRWTARAYAVLLSWGTWMFLRFSFVLSHPLVLWRFLFLLLHHDACQGYPLRSAGDALGGLRVAPVGGSGGCGPILVRQSRSW